MAIPHLSEGLITGGTIRKPIEVDWAIDRTTNPKTYSIIVDHVEVATFEANEEVTFVDILATVRSVCARMDREER